MPTASRTEGGGGGRCRWLAAVVVVVVASALAQRGTATADQPSRGKEVYELRCMPCHGTSGAGDGPAAAAIVPPPRNFRNADFWRGRSMAQLRLVVKQGRPGTLMAPFEGVLSEAEIDDVVAYIQSFRPQAK